MRPFHLYFPIWFNGDFVEALCGPAKQDKQKGISLGLSSALQEFLIWSGYYFAWTTDVYRSKSMNTEMIERRQKAAAL